MGISYTAILFIGAEVPDDHFFTEGKETFACYNHGVQTKKFCGDCGRQTDRTFEKLWTPEMQRAATQMNTTPELLWEKMSDDDGGLSYYSDKGKLGRWGFGYENDYIVYGTCVASAGGDDRPGCEGQHLSPEEFTAHLTRIQDAFKLYGIELPVRVMSISTCG
jgi:hypothetical protein